MDVRKLVSLVCIFSAVCGQTGGQASCPVGYMPPDCQKCRVGLFGVNCASLCPATCTDRSCRPDTGFCYRCRDGFMGPKCSVKCRSGFFGRDCRTPCPLNCFMGVCDPFTGFCQRCIKGYGGVKCERRSVLRNSSGQSEMVDVSDASYVAKTTSKSLVVYVLVVVMSCLLPVCAVLLCVQCARKHASTNQQLAVKPSTTAHIPVSLSTHSRRPTRLALKYQQMKTIEEESSNQLTLEDDLEAGAAVNAAAVSVTTLDKHGHHSNLSHKHSGQSSQATKPDPILCIPETDLPHSYEKHGVFHNTRDYMFDFNETVKGIPEFVVGDIYNKLQETSMTVQSNPTNNYDSGEINNTFSTDPRGRQSLQAVCCRSEEHLNASKGKVVSLSSEMPRRAPYEDAARTQQEFLNTKTPRRSPYSDTAETQLEFLDTETSRRAPYSATAGTQLEFLNPAIADWTSPTSTTATHKGQNGYTNPKMTDLTLRSECSSSCPECVSGQENTQAPTQTEPVWRQVQVIRQVDKPGGDMVYSGSPSDTGKTSQETTDGDAIGTPDADEKISGDAENIQPVCQQIHSKHNHVVNDTFPEYRKSNIGSVAMETHMPWPTGQTYKLKESAVSFHSESTAWPSRPLPLSRGDRHHLNDGPQTQQPDTASVCADARNRALASQQQSDDDCSHGKPRHVGPADVQQRDNPEGIGQTKTGGSFGSSAGLVNLAVDNRRIGAATPHTGVSIPVSTDVSIPLSSGVSIPVSADVSIPVCTGMSIPVSSDVFTPVSDGVTAVLCRCQVIGEEQIIVAGCDQEDMTCRRVHTLDYTQLTVRHQFDCSADDCNVSQDSTSLDLSPDKSNRQTHQMTNGCTDLHSDDVCRREGPSLYTSTACGSRIRNLHENGSINGSVNGSVNGSANGSANNINRLHGVTRQPPSSSSTSSSTPAHEVRRTSCLRSGRGEQCTRSVCKDTLVSQTSMPLFSICSSAPMKLSVTYCPDSHHDERPTCMRPAPRHVSLSSLRNMDHTPVKNRELVDVAVLLTSPPKNRHKRFFKGKDSEKCKHQVTNQIYLESGRCEFSDQRGSEAFKSDQRGSEAFKSDQRGSEAFKYDQFRQVVYTKETPSKHKPASQCHSSVATRPKSITDECTRCEQKRTTVNKKQTNRSDDSHSTCTFDPISQLLDENPIRQNIVPETRNIESLTPVSAIKMSLTQTLNRDILKLRTTNSGTEMIPSTQARDPAKKQTQLSSVVNPQAEFTEEISYTNKYIAQCEAKDDIGNSSWSKNADITLPQEPTHDDIGNDSWSKSSDKTMTQEPKHGRNVRPNELSHTSSAPKSLAPQAETQPVDGTRTIRHMPVLGMSTLTASEKIHWSARLDNSARIEPFRDACKPSQTVPFCDPQMLVLGSRHLRSTTVSMDSVNPIVSDNNYVASLSASDRSTTSSLATSVQEFNTGAHQIGEIFPARAIVLENISGTERRPQSVPPSQNLGLNMFPPGVSREQNVTRSEKFSHKPKSKGWMPPNVEAAGQEPLVIYPLPSLLEELAIWERTVSAAGTDTKPCLLPAKHNHAADSAVEVPVKKSTDHVSEHWWYDVMCSDLCSQDSQSGCHVNNNDDKRPKLESAMCFSDHNNAGSDDKVEVKSNLTPHVCFNHVGDPHRLPFGCQSKDITELSQERHQCCRKNSCEFISVSEDASDEFFDALDNIPVALRPGHCCDQQGQGEYPTTSTRDQKYAVKFVETSARESSNVGFSVARSRETNSSREGKHISKGGETIHRRMRPKTHQQNIAFRFAVPRSTDPAVETLQKSVSKIPNRKRCTKQIHPPEGTDHVRQSPRNPQGWIIPASSEPTEPSARTWRNNTRTRLAGTEATDSAQHRSMSSEKHSRSVNYQHSVAEDFFSIQE